ncbi:MAG: hypothetical protein GF353_08655, partial [Candidatus Lokiarchaeota archaeon]|nr:hypothetical protein [Candidatus Lokiarchaeota archaeon]
MNNPNRIQNHNGTVPIDDNSLLRHFRRLLKKGKIKFIKDVGALNLYDENLEGFSDKVKYAKIAIYKKGKHDSKMKTTLYQILGRYLSIDDNDDRAEKMKERNFIFRRLWPYFVRNAIKLLRNKDTRDKGELKFDFGVKNLMEYFEEFSKFEEILFGVDE